LTSTSEAKPTLIFYTPLIVDWSGSRLFKSLCIKQGAYDYLRRNQVEYTLSYDNLQTGSIPLEAVYNLCGNWVSNPYRLFRCYSIYYLHDLLVEESKKLAIRNRKAYNGNGISCVNVDPDEAKPTKPTVTSSAKTRVVISTCR
jgi:hypothetical protein